MKRRISNLALSRAVAFCGLTLVASAAHATTYTWQKGSKGNNDWFNAKNWLPVGVPGQGDTVVIGSGSDIQASKGIAIAGATVGTRSRVNFSGDCLVDGPLTLNTAEWSSSGALTVNGKLTMNSSTWDGSGSLTANGPASVANSLLAGSQDFTVNNIFNSTDNTFDGSGNQIVTPKGTLNLLSRGANGNLVNRTFSNSGLVVWVSGDLTVNKAFQNESTAVVDLQSTGVLSGRATTSLFRNVGTLKRSQNSGKGTVDIPYTNTGLMDVRTGSLDFSQPLSQDSGECSLNGGNIVARNGMRLHGGKLDGIGTITGNVINDGGIVGPGHSPGMITINGNYTQTANGSLNMEIGGSDPGTGYDKMVVNGNMQIAGTLNIVQYNGFLPADGSNFELFDYYSMAGKFSNVTVNFLPATTFTTTVTPIYYVATAHSAVDIIKPTVSTSLPLANVIYKTIPTAKGKATDNVAVTSATARLYRYATALAPAGYWAGGTTWNSTYNAAVNEIAATGTTSWSFGLPLLPYGSYMLQPTAKDAAGNASVSTGTPFLVSPGKSLIGVSAIAATSSNRHVVLNFLGPLDSVVLKTPSHFTVTVNGTAQVLNVQSVGYSTTTNAVTLTLAPGALVPGNQITVKWMNLFDVTGMYLTGQSGLVTVQ